MHAECGRVCAHLRWRRGLRRARRPRRGALLLVVLCRCLIVPCCGLGPISLVNVVAQEGVQLTRKQASEGSASGELGGPGAGAYVRYEAHRFIEGLARGFALLGIGDLACLAHLLKRLRWRPITQAYTREGGGGEAVRGRRLAHTSLKTFFWSSPIDAVNV